MAYEALAQAFQSGDVVYGLDKPRKAAIDAIVHVGHTRQVTYHTRILSCIPGKAVTKAVILIQNDLTNAVWDPQRPNAYSKNSQIKKQLDDPQRGRQFKTFLSSHPKYNVAQHNQFGQTANPADAATAAWTRTSKAGLEFQTRRNATVHFVVDKIIDNLEDVAKKQNHGTSITSSELRWLYRHRDVDDVKNSVRFWRSGGEVDHDALFNRPEWDSYTPKHNYAADWKQSENLGIQNVIKNVKSPV